MYRTRTVAFLISLALFALNSPAPVLAQEGEPTNSPQEPAFFTTYPSQVIGIGETANFSLTLRVGSSPQTFRLEMKQVPDGWTATFRGGGQIVQAIYAEPDNPVSVELRLEPPADVQPGDYRFVVVADSGSLALDLLLDLTVKEKLPPSLSFEVELPTLQGSPTTTFRYNVTLKNDGDEDLSVNLLVDSPEFFMVSFNLSGQDVTSIPLAASESKRLSVEAQPVGEVPAGSYPVTIQAQGGEAQASLILTAVVTGQPDLTVTAPDGRLSGQAYAGRLMPLKIVVRNDGTAPARVIDLTSSEPTGWSVEFTPNQIPEIPAGQQVEVTANIRPSENAVAGDFIISVRAQPAEGATQSADFRITVLTSTLWGVVGLGLVAIALGVVAIAVVRFGRR